MLNSSTRGSRVAPFHAMAMAKLAERKAATGREVLHLEVGQPSSPAPRRRQGGCGESDRARPDRLHERPWAADAPAADRRALADDWYGVDVDSDRVLVVAGASAGFTLAFLACFDPGDRVGVIEPGYPCYRNTLDRAGHASRSRSRSGRRRAGHRPPSSSPPPARSTVWSSRRRRTRPARCSAPTRSASWWRTAAADGIRLISDEIYHGIVFGEPRSTQRSSSTTT